MSNGRESPDAVEVNPPPPELSRSNAIVTGELAAHHCRDVVGTLSIKLVLRGAATWRTDDGTYELWPDRYLVLNDGVRYGMDVDSPREPTRRFASSSGGAS
jgi:hypothetical protein